MPASGSAAAVILAAGLSKRLPGRAPKQLLELEGEPLVRRVARRAIASRLSPVVVVTGHRAAAVAAAVEELDVEIAHNPRYEEGQSTSVRCGLERIRDRCAAAVFIPADMPRLGAPLLDRLVEAWERTGAPIVVPVHGGKRGAPVLIGADLYGELARIEGDAGGRQLFPAHESEIAEVASEEPLVDIDSEADLSDLRTNLRTDSQ